jgi:flagellar protein FlgJ
MNVAALQSKVDASHVSLESLAGNKALSQDQKIGEASRQFEAVLLRQFLSESQKPVINSEFTDNSNIAGIYQDMITNQLADSLSRGGGIGLAKTFERQLTPHVAHHGVASLSSQANTSAAPVSKQAALLMPTPAAPVQPVDSSLSHHFSHP